MEQAFGQLKAALHPSRKGFGLFMGTVRESNPAEHFFDTSAQDCTSQAVKVALVAQIFNGRQLHIYALCLKYNTDLATQASGIARNIAFLDYRAAAARQHERGENAEQRSFAAAVRTE